MSVVSIEPLLGLVNSPIDAVTLAYLAYEIRFGRLRHFEETIASFRREIVTIASEVDGVDGDLVERRLDR